MNFRRFPNTNASTSPRTRHHRASTDQAPQQPHAAAAPTPTDLYAGSYRYEAGTIPGLREHADKCRETATQREAQANALLASAQRLRIQAADHERIAALAELDAQTPDGAQWPQAAPQLPAPTAPIVHFSDNVAFWPPCGARTEATWQTVNPAEVTCAGCLSSMAVAQATGVNGWQPGREGPGEPHPDEGGPSTYLRQYPPAELPDTLTFAKVEAQR